MKRGKDGLFRPRWYFGPPSIPVRAVGISTLALAVPLAASVTAGSEPGRFEALLWLTALIPGFLLAYYRGWSGVATGLASGMAVFSLVQVYLVQTGQRLPDWTFMLAMTSALVLVSLVAGGVTDRLHGEREKAERLALIDELTDLPNRRYLGLMLEREFAAARRGRGLVVVAFDVDGLKDINDRHGHAAGDDALRAFASILKANTRTMDMSARLAGDEFVTVLSSANVQGALVFVRRVQHATKVAALSAPITVSAGLARYQSHMEDADSLVRAADTALYRAKQEPTGWMVAGGEDGADAADGTTGADATAPGPERQRRSAAV